ncbi:MAG: phasin family protein [Alphaproteobacteria bacterium]|jgi:phasin family protein|nr:TIGR01841 family phasin [Rickettsiales bacterium]
MAAQNPFADAMKVFGDFKAPQMPTIDVNGVLAFNRRNAEAASAASQCMAEGLQTIARRQAELARAQVDKVLKTTKDMMTGGSPEVNTTKQMELAKTMFENSLSNLREVSELVTKSGFELFDVVNRRAAESLDEITSLSGKAAKKSASSAN